MSQQERRRNPYPWTWEPVACIVAALLLVGLVGVQVGRSVANLAAVGSWQIAPVTSWAGSGPAVLTGRAAAGLTPVPDRVASPAVLWTVLTLVEALLLTCAVVGLRRGWRRWSPHRPQGFASTADVDRVLGVRRLRRVAHLIRPDLDQQRPTRRGDV